MQTLLGWGWAFSKTDTDYYRGQGGAFSEEENIALEQLKSILEKDTGSYGWLWERYAGNEIKNPDEQKIWNKIVFALSPRFEKLWKEELPLLESWRDGLVSTNGEVINKTIETFSNFVEVDELIQKEIEVRLCTGYFPDAPEGHAKKEFPTFVIANISHTSHEYATRVLGLITHEILHKIEYQPPTLSELLKGAYEKVIKSTEIKAQWKWKYLLTESVLHSVASKRYNTYFGRMVMKNEEKIANDVLLSLDMEKYGDSHGALIRVVAGRIESLTTKYLNEGRIVDEAYCNEVAKNWVNLLSAK